MAILLECSHQGGVLGHTHTQLGGTQRFFVENRRPVTPGMVRWKFKQLDWGCKL